MKKRSRKIMYIMMGIFLILAGVITIFFTIPYSKTKTEFYRATRILIVSADRAEGVFRQEDIIGLPIPVQKYFKYCGYIGTPKMQTMKAVYKDVKFKFGKGKPTVIIDYVQYNIADEPARIACIDSSMYGIPFEGLDSYTAGNGSMKGVLAKLFTLFHQVGDTMDRASLATYLSECLLIPNAAIQDYIIWEEVDALHAKATMSYYGNTASGIFTFRENGEMLSFTTDDREAITTDGKSEKVKWSVVLGDYEEIEGIKKPTLFQAIWHYDDGDLLYFDGKDVVIEFDEQIH